MRRLAALAVALVAACSSGPPERDPTWSAELSTAPTLLVLGADDVWAASYGNGVGGSQVYRVDRDTGRRAAQRTVAGQPNGMALGPDGELWLATLRLPDQPTGTALQVLDPQTLQTRRAVDVPALPLSVAEVDGRLWVGFPDGVRRVDGAALGPLLPTPERALRLLPAGRDRLLVAGTSSLALLDTGTGRTVATRRVPASGSVVPAVDDGHLWVVAPDERARARLQRYDPATLAPGPVATSPGGAGAVAALGDDVLWLADPAGGRLVCADAVTAQARSERSLPVTGPLAADGEAVVVAVRDGLRSVPARCTQPSG